MSQPVAFVTGCSSGIGRALADAFQRAGYRVWASARKEDDVRALAEAGFQAVQLDVNDAAALARLAEELEVEAAGLDVLVNNAGYGAMGPLLDGGVDAMRRQFETNVFANLELTQGFVRRMVEQKRGGKVLFVSSIAGLITGPYTGPYCASKHALEAFAEALHAELKPFGIQVGTINPGPYQTGFNDRMMETWKRWYDPQRHFTDHSGVRFPFEQYDPEEMIARMVELAEADEGPFRTLLPEAFVEVVKDEQVQAWQRRL
ncbi:SDR family oxidoreductase [Pseudomonas aeruginosa]|nr:SDR family oxidoreductase [Pseudomonas aeruginosa]